MIRMTPPMNTTVLGASFYIADFDRFNTRKDYYMT